MSQWSRMGRMAVMVVAMVLAAQPAVVASAQSQNTAAAQAPNPTAAQTAAPVSVATHEDLGATQQELMRLLRVTPTLADVVASDPSLLADQQYVAKTNPELAQFLVQHPEIGRNPSFWLFSELRRPEETPYDVLQPKQGFVSPRSGNDSLERLVDDLVPPIVIVALLIALAWVIRLLVENRRWTKVFSLQSEVHGRLIERFATNQELLGYMETDAGRKFLEASPIVTEAETRKVPNLISRMMATLQTGLVLTLLGIGLISLKNVVGEDGRSMLVLGVIALMPGIGLILSAGVLWLLGKRLNLVETSAPVDAGLRGRQ